MIGVFAVPAANAGFFLSTLFRPDCAAASPSLPGPTASWAEEPSGGAACSDNSDICPAICESFLRRDFTSSSSCSNLCMACVAPPNLRPKAAAATAHSSLQYPGPCSASYTFCSLGSILYFPWGLSTRGGWEHVALPHIPARVRSSAAAKNSSPDITRATAHRRASFSKLPSMSLHVSHRGLVRERNARSLVAPAVRSEEMGLTSPWHGMRLWHASQPLLMGHAVLPFVISTARPLYASRTPGDPSRFSLKLSSSISSIYMHACSIIVLIMC